MVQNEAGAFGDAEERVFRHVRLHAEETLKKFRHMVELHGATRKMIPFSMISATSSGGVSLNTLWMALAISTR